MLSIKVYSYNSHKQDKKTSTKHTMVLEECNKDNNMWERVVIMSPTDNIVEKPIPSTMMRILTCSLRTSLPSIGGGVLSTLNINLWRHCQSHSRHHHNNNPKTRHWQGSNSPTIPYKSSRKENMANIHSAKRKKNEVEGNMGTSNTNKQQGT
jgi:hypothetical protein